MPESVDRGMAGEVSTADATGLVRIIGSRQFFWPQPTYDLILDGTVVDNMGLKEEKDIRVAPGRHTIRAMWNLRFYWRRSAPVDFEIARGETLLLQIKHDRINGGVVLRRF